MTIPSESYEDIFEQYSDAVKWMMGLGIKIGPGRTSHYEKIVGYWKDAYKTATADEGQKSFPDFVSSMFEVFDFVSIYKAFNKVPAHRLTSVIEKLQKGVNGPINAADETPESTTARNFLFEAASAAKVHRPDRGIEAVFDARSDTGFNLNGKKVLIECKRVTAIEKIESNVRKASSQLETILAGETVSGHCGMVAMDISKILNRGDMIFVTRNDDELTASVDSIMDQFIREQSQIWERVYQRRPKSIVGTIIRFSFMASSEARNILVHASQWAVNPRLGIDAHDEQLQRKLAITLATAL